MSNCHFIFRRAYHSMFWAILCAVIGLGCERRVEARSVVYVDGQIKAAHSKTYDPALRTCGRGMETVYRTLKGAADSILPGQTLLIRAGQYTEALRPAQSGQAGNYICFKNFPDEEPVITGASLDPAIDISDRSYLIIEGLKITNVRRWFYGIRAHHNIIRNNHFSKAVHPSGSSKAGLFFQQAMYNTITGNTVEDSTQDNLSLIKSDRNLVENNTFRKAKHTLWTIKGGNFNVLRGNYFHNELQKIGEVYDCHGVGYDHEFYEYDCTKHNLIEKNRFAYTASSGNHSPYAGIQYAGQNGIIRNNLFYDTVGPALSLTLYGKEANYNTGNRIYHNVFYGTDFAGIDLSPSKVFAFKDNKILNNVFSKSIFVANDTRWPWWKNELAGKPVQMLVGRLNGFVCQNNSFFDKGRNAPYLVTLGHRGPLVRNQRPLRGVEYSQPELFRDNMELDPLFVNEERRDFHLKPDSQMIDAGMFLTRTTDSGSGRHLPVEDVGCFYDGYDIPGEKGDLIRLEGQEYVARIIDSDYKSNILELSQSLVWEKGQGVSLYYLGKRPDLGAYEFVPGGNRSPIADFSAYPQADAPFRIDLDASASTDPDGTIVEYNWDLGDGTTIPNGDARGSHAYMEPGTYTVTLEVADNSQSRRVGKATQIVRIGEPVLDVQPDSLDFGAKTEAQAVDLKNMGKGTLVYKILTSTPWLSIDKHSGYCAETQPIMVTVDRTGLKVGKYAGIVRIDAGSAGERHVEVSMEVPLLIEERLITVGDIWRYFKGVSAPPVKWNTLDFDDSNWLQGPSGIGYSNDVTYATILRDMMGKYTSFYMRRLFILSDADSMVNLQLGIQYDDGFIAYLNGHEVARSASMGPAGAATVYGKAPLSKHDEEAPEEIYDIEVKPGWLFSGENVLAVELYNYNARSSDACAVPRLVGSVIRLK